MTDSFEEREGYRQFGKAELIHADPLRPPAYEHDHAPLPNMVKIVGVAPLLR